MKDGNLDITISTSTIVKTLALGALVWMAYFFKELILLILTAIVISSSIEPLIEKLVKSKIPRVFSVTFVYISLISLIFAVLVFFVPPLAKQSTEIITDLPQHIEGIDNWIDQKVTEGGTVSAILNELTPKDTVGENVSVKDLVKERSESLGNVIILIFGGIVNFLLILVLSFYFSLQDHSVDNFIKMITLPKYKKYALNLWKRAQKKIGLWMQGQLILALIVGSLVFLGLSGMEIVLGFELENILLLSVLAAFAELVPVFGPVIAAIPAIILGLFSGGAPVAIAIAVFYFFIQQIENQLIYPMVVNKVVGVPPLLVIISIIIGGQLFGFLGVLLSIPVAAALMELVADIEKRQREALRTGEEEEVNLAKKKQEPEEEKKKQLKRKARKMSS